jgi:hypothetical protein
MKNKQINKFILNSTKGIFIYFLVVIIVFGCGNDENKNEINFVNFEYSHSMRIPNNKVFISIIKRRNETEVIVLSDPMNNDPKWLYTKINRRFKIKTEVYDELSKDLLKLNRMNLDKAACDGRDGTTCSIEIGKIGASKTYNIWSPDFDTENRELLDYLNLCIQIIKIGKLDPKVIL